MVKFESGDMREMRLVRNLALEGNLVVVVGEHRAQAMTVDSSTGHSFAPAPIAALDNQDALARFSELVGGNRSGASGSGRR